MPPNEAVGQELEWRQPEALHRFYQLTQEESEIATLRFETSCGSLSPKISVREAGSETDLALLTPGWTGNGWVVFGSGRRYHLRHTNFWGTEWAFEAEDGKPAITLSRKQGLFKQGGAATVAPVLRPAFQPAR